MKHKKINNGEHIEQKFYQNVLYKLKSVKNDEKSLKTDGTKCKIE